ncbi:MAG: serine/threonine protein kinase, partial [Myxococcales bacterium]|nr:serine/threonine protein kinase [Myxococcales bacterium]
APADELGATERVALDSLKSMLFGTPVVERRYGRYRVIRPLGEGGMGTVFSAFDDELARPVALKVLRSTGRGAQAARERMTREAQAMAQLSHPNVVQVYDVGVHEGELYIAMELVRGVTLQDWVAELGSPIERARRWSQVVALFVQAARGLAAAHAVGLVHRDFKPANVFVSTQKDSGTSVRVGDFGLAFGDRERLESSGELSPRDADALQLGKDLTVTGTILGTPAYFSPEQLRGEVLGPASDQFSFCVALHEALLGVRPFTGSTLDELARNLLGGVRATPGKDVQIPGWLQAVIDRGLAATPEARWPSMDALVDALLDDPAQRRRRRIVAGVGVVTIAAVALGAWVQDRRERAFCTAEGQAIAERWNPARRQEIGEAFVATGAGHADEAWERVAPQLDAWALGWSEAREAACLHGRERADEGLARATCLERRRWQFDSLLDLLTAADRATVFEAADAVAALPVL